MIKLGLKIEWTQFCLWCGAMRIKAKWAFILSGEQKMRRQTRMMNEQSWLNLSLRSNAHNFVDDVAQCELKEIEVNDL